MITVILDAQRHVGHNVVRLYLSNDLGESFPIITKVVEDNMENELTLDDYVENATGYGQKIANVLCAHFITFNDIAVLPNDIVLSPA